MLKQQAEAEAAKEELRQTIQDLTDDLKQLRAQAGCRVCGYGE
jgi:hypothetical protein